MKYLLAVLALASSSALVSAPLNDSFSKATPITANSGTFSGSNVGATLESGEPDHANITTGASVWWNWTPTISGTATVSTTGSSFDTVLAVYRGSSVITTDVQAYSDDETPVILTSKTSFTVAANTSYRIAVAGYNGDSGAIKLNLSVGSGFFSSENDNYVDRLHLSGDFTVVTGTSRNATDEPEENSRYYQYDDYLYHDPILDIDIPFSYSSYGDKSVWWTWTAPHSGTVTITNKMNIISQFVGDDLTAFIEVFSTDTDDIADLEPIPFGDESAGFTPEQTAQITLDVTAGQVLQIKAKSWDANLGSRITLTIEMDAPTLLNDSFNKRILIKSSNASLTADNTDATAELGEPMHAGSDANKSLWWWWVAPGNGYVNIDTEGSSTGTVMETYTGNTLGSLVAITSADNTDTMVHIPVVKGAAYQIAVDSTIDGGAISLSLSYIPDTISIIQQPDNQTAQLNDLSATFSIVNTGAPTVYNWQRKKAGSKTWDSFGPGVAPAATLPGKEVTNTLTIAGPITGDMDGDEFRCVLTNSSGQTISKSAKLRVISLITYSGSDLSMSLPAVVADSVTYFAKGLPKGLKLNRNTGEITGRLSANDGSYTFTYYAKTVTGGSKSTTAKQTVLIVVQPFPSELTGSFEGLMQDGLGLPVGKLSLTVSRTGSFSGTVIYQGEKKAGALKGSLVLNSSTTPTAASTTVNAKGGLSVALTINNDGTMDATLSKSSVAVGDLMGDGMSLAGYTLVNQSPFKGVYTLALTAPTVGPEGSGYAQANLKENGFLNLLGKLADGTKFTASLKPDSGSVSTYRLFVQPYKDKRGYVTGWLPLSDRADGTGLYHVSAADGSDFYWVKAASKKEKAYPTGFGPAGLTAIMEPWRVNDTSFTLGYLGLITNNALVVGNFNLLLSLDQAETISNQGGNAEQLPVNLNLSFNNKVSVLNTDPNPGNPRGWSVNVHANNGVFTASFILSDKRKVSVEGVLLQSPSPTSPNIFGHGFFLVPPVKTKPASGSILSGDVQFIGPAIP